MTALADVLDSLRKQSSAFEGLGFRAFLEIAGIIVCVHSMDEELLEAFVSPYANLLVDSDAADAVVWIESHARVKDSHLRLPDPLPTSEAEPGLGMIQMDSYFQRVVAADERRRRVYAFMNSTSGFDLRVAGVSRSMVDLVIAMCAPRDSLVHGGTIGDAHRGVLIPGKSGAGKSTLVTAAVGHGFRTAGDDCLVLRQRAGHPPLVFPTTSTVKLRPDSPAYPFVEGMASIDVIDGMPIEPKRVFWLADRYPEALVMSHEVAAVVVPSRGPEFSIREVPPALALHALVPSSAVMAYRPRHVTEQLAALCESLPAYAVTLTPDMPGNLARIGPWLESLGVATPGAQT